MEYAKFAGNVKEQFVMYMKFIRVHVALTWAAVAMLGCFAAGTPSEVSASIFFSTFFIVGATYAYNSTKDGDEDRANKLELHPYIRSGKGGLVCAATFLSGLGAASFAGASVFLFAFACTVIGYAYSALRVKRFVIVKTAYIALSDALLVIWGFVYKMNFSEVAWYYFVSIFSLVFGMSLISDMKDYDGDKAASVPTIPVVFGLHSAKVVSSITMLLPLVLDIRGPGVFLPALPFVAFAVVKMLGKCRLHVPLKYARYGMFAIVAVQVVRGAGI